MDTSKLVDHLMVTLKYPVATSPRSCFAVFSSKEEHVEIVIDCVETVFEKLGKYQLVRLDERLASGDSQYGELRDQLATCAFAVVVLDGFRPNVLFEYGVLKGLGKPCIVLLEEKATVDIKSFLPSEEGSCPPAPLIDMDKHFSDVKDRFYLRYSRNKPKQIRAVLKNEYNKLKKQIEDEFLRVIFPHKEFVEKELSIHLGTIADIFSTIQPATDTTTLTNIGVARSHVERIVREHRLSLPPDYFITLAEIYEKAEKLDLALEVINSAPKESGEDASLLSQKAHLLLVLGRMPEAIITLDHAIALHPDREFLWHDKGTVLHSLGRIEEAMACYKNGIALDSACPTIHYQYGILLYEKKDFASALAEFDKALETPPPESDWCLWKAQSLDKLGKTNEALDIIKSLIAKDQTNADAWYVLARLTEDNSERLGFFQKAVQLDPHHSGALCSSAATLSNLGKHDEALGIFRRMHDVCPEHESCPTLIENICLTLNRMGRSDEAMKTSEEILAKNPNHTGAQVGKALCLSQIGRYDEALVIFSKLLETAPEDANLWYNQACIYAIANKASKAVQSLAKAISLDRHYERTMRKDPDFDPVRSTRPFRTAFPKAVQGPRPTRTQAKQAR